MTLPQTRKFTTDLVPNLLLTSSSAAELSVLAPQAMTVPQSAYIRGIVGGNRPLLLLKPRFQVRHVSHRMPKAMHACILKASVYA
jgi:hypothetical protein